MWITDLLVLGIFADYYNRTYVSTISDVEIFKRHMRDAISV